MREKIKYYQKKLDEAKLSELDDSISRYIEYKRKRG